jgi:hypothetical protein
MAFTAVSFEILRSLFRARRNLDTRAMVVQVFRVVGICGRGIVSASIRTQVVRAPWLQVQKQQEPCALLG